MPIVGCWKYFGNFLLLVFSRKGSFTLVFLAGVIGWLCAVKYQDVYACGRILFMAFLFCFVLLVLCGLMCVRLALIGTWENGLLFVLPFQRCVV